MRELSGAWMRHSGDFWGGFASMLVALPASVAFGVTVYAAIDPHYAAFGALAGVLGAMALGLIAPTFGGTDRLITAPCAPAAAVLSAFAMAVYNERLGQQERFRQAEVQLRADTSVPYGRVVQVMGWAHAAGLTRIGFVAEPESKAGIN